MNFGVNSSFYCIPMTNAQGENESKVKKKRKFMHEDKSIKQLSKKFAALCQEDTSEIKMLEIKEIQENKFELKVSLAEENSKINDN